MIDTICYLLWVRLSEIRQLKANSEISRKNNITKFEDTPNNAIFFVYFTDKEG